MVADVEDGLPRGDLEHLLQVEPVSTLEHFALPKERSRTLGPHAVAVPEDVAGRVRRCCTLRRVDAEQAQVRILRMRAGPGRERREGQAQAHHFPSLRVAL